MVYRSYSDDTQAAVMAALLTGQSATQVAKAYEIPKGTVSNWKRKVWEAAADGIETPDGPPREQIGALFLDYLQASLKVLRHQAELFADGE